MTTKTNVKALSASDEMTTPFDWEVWRTQLDEVTERILVGYNGHLPDFDAIWQLSREELVHRLDSFVLAELEQ